MQSQKSCKRIVIKIGASLFCASGLKLDAGMLAALAQEISGLVQEGKEIVIVSSGAIALGSSILDLDGRPKELSLLQAAAAVGQHELMQAYRRFLNRHGLNCGQLLLTWEDFSDRKRYLNAKATLNTLLKLKVIPVINENDTVSTEEIKFGDNDRLSALVSILVGADLLLILSDVDGLMDKDKKVIRVVDKITSQVKSLATSTRRNTCVGGMITKIEAAHIATSSGIPCVIANGHKKDIIRLASADIFSNGTLFLPAAGLLGAKERWIAFGTQAKGKIVVDDGAKKALLDKKSLLAVGVVSSSGDFSTGEIVSICDHKGYEFARGKAGFNAGEINKIKGNRFGKEIIHRDNIVIIGE